MSTKTTPRGPRDGTSWASAFITIQEGVNAAFDDGGGEVWVAEGAYTATTNPVVAVKENADLYGGFTGTETIRDQDDGQTRVTTIDGEDARACVEGADGSVLDGFVATGGASHGMYNLGCSPTAAECAFRSNCSCGVYNEGCPSQ